MGLPCGDLPIHSGCGGAGEGAVDPFDAGLTLRERWLKVTGKKWNVKSRNVDFAENFEDLKIWQRSRALANEVCDSMNTEFLKILKDQP